MNEEYRKAERYNLTQLGRSRPLRTSLYSEQAEA